MGDESTNRDAWIAVETPYVGGPAQQSLRRYRLRVVAGTDAGAQLLSRNLTTVIGTHPSADLVLRDSTVSRFHCQLTLAGDHVRLRDLDSRNGTLVNGVAIVEAKLLGDTTFALGHTQLRFEVAGDRVEVPLSKRDQFGALVGASLPMRAAFALLERAAECDSVVLLLGETGTGKEAAAESIHQASARKSGPFVVVDCGAIPPQLLESELFGHEKGAFTGATAARRGALEAAAGGTIFFDEIGELGAEMQTRLLRVLERREVKRVGADRYQPVDVRVIAATNRDLKLEVNARRFRADLYHRLAVLEVRMPPLRERRDDLPTLVEHLLKLLQASARPEAELLRSTEFQADLRRHDWPGNVRELRNHLERCLALHQRMPLTSELDAQPLGDEAPPVGADRPLKAAREEWLRSFERRYLEELVQNQGGNVAAAARAAGVARGYFYRLLWRHGLR